jgi:hypothetical protein
MNTDRPISFKRLSCTAAAAMVAAMALVLVMASLSSARNETAPLGSPGTGADPEIRYVTVTADLPTYDPTGQEGVTKTVYFNNVSSGTITVTFDISGTPTLTLTAGGGFAEPERIYTSAGQTSSQAITYAVVPADTTQPNVPYTATNANGIQTTIAITYVRDISAPVSGSVAVDGGANYATQAGVTLTLSATDAGCGVAARCITDTGTARRWQDRLRMVPRPSAECIWPSHRRNHAGPATTDRGDHRSHADYRDSVPRLLVG